MKTLGQFSASLVIALLLFLPVSYGEQPTAPATETPAPPASAPESPASLQPGEPAPSPAVPAKPVSKNPLVRMTTSLGVVEIELYPDKAPESVENFLKYVRSDFYDATLFHRVIKGFMIQGGGFKSGLRQKPTRTPIKNEADNGLKNETGTVAMARTGDPHSATAQFFINTADNSPLNHSSKTVSGWGYTVFGRVTRGMNVVRKIEAVDTGSLGPFQDVPKTDVLIKKIEIIRDLDKVSNLGIDLR